jgi:RNA polymerase sigma-70 factor (sigma-E family)
VDNAKGLRARCLSESLAHDRRGTGVSVTFDEFAATRLDAVLRFAVVLTNDRGLAEDVVQEVLIRAHQRWAQIGELEHPEAYVRRMVVNEFLSWRRKWARYVPQADIEPLMSQTTQPDHADAQAERATLLAEVAKLPRRQRAVLVLRYYEGLSDAQIADVLGCAETTVRGYAFRALAALRVELTSAELT